jgi:peptidoglycan/xylan/chitin deacetylase (PgdA/CDA1 family)
MSNFFILNYHTIVPHWGFDVACRTLDFEFSLLKKFFHVVPLDEICAIVKSGKPPDRPTVAVTFDDGYLDTFVYACPLCKKHGIRATLFPIASRIRKDECVRPTLEDHWNGKIAYRELYRTKRMDVCNRDFLETGENDSFMSVAELRQVMKYMDIGCHGSVHAQVFCEDRILDFIDGTNGGCSNVYAYEEKPIRGFPLFPEQSNLAARRGFLRPEIKKYVRAIDDAFFSQLIWKEQLHADLDKKFSSFLTFENDLERNTRTNDELTKSREWLETMTGNKIRHFAYPYGQHDPVLEKAVEEHFDAAFTTDIDIVRFENRMHLLPRAKVHKDISSFISRVVKFSTRK